MPRTKEEMLATGELHVDGGERTALRAYVQFVREHLDSLDLALSRDDHREIVNQALQAKLWAATVLDSAGRVVENDGIEIIWAHGFVVGARPTRHR